MRPSLTPAWLIETRFMSLGVTRLHLGPVLGVALGKAGRD